MSKSTEDLENFYKKDKIGITDIFDGNSSNLNIKTTSSVENVPVPKNLFGPVNRKLSSLTKSKNISFITDDEFRSPKRNSSKYQSSLCTNIRW